MKYQCYYNETIKCNEGNYIGKRVDTECFDTEEDAERYCDYHVGTQKCGDEYMENEMKYEEVEV